MFRLRRIIAVVIGCLTLSLPLAAPRADDGDPAGWSGTTDPRRRAFLVVTDAAGGPRLLTIACLRDADEFAIYASDLPGLANVKGAADLTLSVAGASFTLPGRVDTDGFGRLGFTGFRDLDGAGVKALARELLPVLKAPGPMVVTVGSSAPLTIPLAEASPRKGIAGPLKAFEKICFGR